MYNFIVTLRNNYERVRTSTDEATIKLFRDRNAARAGQYSETSLERRAALMMVSFCNVLLYGTKEDITSARCRLDNAFSAFNLNRGEFTSNN